MPGECQQSGIELNLPRRSIVPHHQPAVVVEQHFLGYPAKVTERTFQPRKPALLPFIAEGPDIQSPRVTQGGHEQIDPDVLATNQRPPLAEIDLQLTTRRRLKSDRRSCLRLERSLS